MKKLLIIAAFVALAFGVTHASTYLNIFGGEYFDIELPPQPCGLAGVRTAVPFLQNGDVFILYTCSNSRIIARQFPHVIVPQPAPTVSCAHIPGFVPTKDGNGCVPPGHPLAR